MENNQGIELDEKIMQAQLIARNVMKKEMLGFYAVLIAGTLSFFLFGLGKPIALIVYLLFLIAFRTATVWYQWNFLIRFQLTCPHCGKPLAERVHFLRSPNHNCPHCGKRALAPLKQLVEYGKSANK